VRDDEKPPLPVEIEWEEREPLDMGVIEDPNDFQLGIKDEPPNDGLVLMFPKANKGLLFSGDALTKLLYLFDTLLHAAVNSQSSGAGEAPRGKAKKVTLH
jgi:hypothetical protein